MLQAVECLPCGVGARQARQQGLQAVVAADPLEIGNQFQAARRTLTPTQLLASLHTHPKTDVLAANGGGQLTTSMDLKSKALEAFCQTLHIVQDGGQDGEMGHAAQLLSPDPSDAPLRLAVLASGSGSNFQALVEALRDEQRLQVVLLIVNRPGCGAQKRAEQLGVPCQLIDHTCFDSRDAVDAAVVQALQNAAVELVVMAGWMRIVTPALISPFQGRLLNIHPSLLPAFRGMHAIRQALAAGVSQTGCTVHEVVEDVDAGPVLGQQVVAIEANDDEASLSARIDAAEHQLLPAVVIKKGLSLLSQRP